MTLKYFFSSKSYPCLLSLVLRSFGCFFNEGPLRCLPANASIMRWMKRFNDCRIEVNDPRARCWKRKVFSVISERANVMLANSRHCRSSPNQTNTAQSRIASKRAAVLLAVAEGTLRLILSLSKSSNTHSIALLTLWCQSCAFSHVKRNDSLLHWTWSDKDMLKGLLAPQFTTTMPLCW